MSWVDSIRTTAFAALADRKTAIRRTFTEEPFIWYPQDVWLSRAKQPRVRSRPATTRDPAAPVRQAAVRRG